MDNLIGAFADEALPEEIATRIKTLDRLLQSLNYSDHIVGVQNIISMSEDQIIEDTRSGVEGVLIDAAKSMISEYGVRLENDDVVVVTAVLKVLNNLVEYEDIDTLLDHCDQGTPEDSLALIVESIEGVDVTRTLEAIDYVSPALIVRVESILREQQNQLENAGLNVDSEKVERIRDRLFKFFEKYPNTNIKQLFEDGYRVGYKLTTYIDKALPLVDSQNRDMQVMAIDVVAACYASGMVEQDIEHNVEGELESYTKDTHELQVLMSKIRKITYGGQNEAD